MGNAKVCISVVSYASVGALVVKACIENKTDYVDAEGNIPIQRRWYDEYHEKAVANNVRVRFLDWLQDDYVFLIAYCILAYSCLRHV